MDMPMIRNISRATIILEHAKSGPIVLKPNQTAELTATDLSLPLVRHYIEVKRLQLVAQQPLGASVILSR
jgi:hypothetical protein